MSSNNDLSRRDFFKTAGIAGAGAVLAAREARGQAVTGPDDKRLEESQIVPSRPFGKTGVQVSILSLGGMFDIPSNQLLLKQALKWGVTYWDTADCYEGGKSETGIGQFFKKDPEARKKVFLVSKSDARDPSGMTKLLKRSLEKMNTGYIDLYFVHGISSIDEVKKKETRAWAENAKAEGKIKLFGFSAHSNMEECMLAAANMDWIDGLMIAYNFRTMNAPRMKAAVEACARAGIGLTAMKTQGGGAVRVESEAELQMAGRFVKQGFTDKQAKLMAVWQNPDIASICSQMPNMTVLMSNVGAALNRTKLSSEDLELLQRYALETCSSYCAGCSEICESALPGETPIREVMRHLMYFNSYGDRDRARDLFARLPEGVRSSLASLDFSAAEAICPQKVQIGRLMREASTLLA